MYQILLESPKFYRRYYKKTFWSLFFLDTLYITSLNIVNLLLSDFLTYLSSFFCVTRSLISLAVNI